ncbi:MAG: ImmA/IrrE family metallo-endopeptidase [Eubacterium sp.]|nr:ImmA/IrrE family metallo-endopeptidase [Eubacterium sp.]
MASWEYFIYSKSGKYSPEDIAKTLISKGYEDGVSCKATSKQNIALDSYNVFGSEIKENINIPEGKEGIMFSSEIENEDKIKQLFNIFQRRDIEAKLNYKFGDIDYKDYFEDTALEIDGKTYFAQLKSEKEMMGSSLIPGESYVSQEQFDEATRFNQRYDFYNCTFDDIKFTDNVVIGKLENCRFNRCTFENFDGTKMNLSHSTFADCKIISSNFENAYFEGADIYHSEINKSLFKMANFSTASIRNTEFKGNDLSSVLLYGATLNDVIMRDTVIQNPPEGLYLEDIYLDGATHQELEARQQEIVNQLRIEPISSAYVVQQAQEQLEPIYNQSEINLIAKYEDIFNIPNSDRNTEWFGDYSLNTIKSNINDTQFKQRLETAKLELVEYWHTHDTGNSLREFLGFSDKEFEEIFAGELTNEHTQIDLEKANNNSFSIEQETSLINEHSKQQFEIINKYNPAPNSYQTWIRGAAEIKSFEETLKDSDFEGWKTEGFDESYSARNAEFALKSGKITVYSSHPIKQGVFVTPSPMEAKSYSADGKIYSKEVFLDEVAWIDPTQGQYANVEEYKLLSPSEIEIKFNAEEWSIVDKISQKELELPSGYTPDELLYVMAQECPEYREFINNNFDKLLNEIHSAEQAISDQAISVEHDRLSAAISQGGFGADMADSAAYHKLQHLENQMSSSNEILENKVEPEILKIDNTAFDDDNYLHFSVDTDGYRLNGYFRIYDPANGSEMKIVNIENSNLHPQIIKQWDDIAKQCQEVSLKKYKEITGKDFSFSNQILENKTKSKINKQPNSLSKETMQSERSKSLTKEEFDKLTSEIKDIAKTYQADPDLITDYLAFKAQFYQYSPTNAMLIHLQNPYATFVASFTKWKELGYSIKKGQHHIKISRPIEVSKFLRNVDGKTQWMNVKYASPEEKAKIANGELEIKKTTKFIPHQVFDISQTDCPVEDYPKFYNMGHPDMEQQQLYECVKEYAKECGFTVKERDLSSISLHGYYDLNDNSIHINSLLKDSERLRTMCHELAHSVLHKTSTQPVEIKEFEAECFSAMLKRKMGFPVSEESKRYIKQYYNKANHIQNGKFDMSKTLNRLSKIFNHISKGIDTTISNMGFNQDREHAHTLSQANNKAVDVAKISENFIQALS